MRLIGNTVAKSLSYSCEDRDIIYKFELDTNK